MLDKVDCVSYKNERVCKGLRGRDNCNNCKFYRTQVEEVERKLATIQRLNKLKIMNQVIEKYGRII